MSLAELLHPDLTQINIRDRGKLAVEGWRRITTPFTAFSFAMIALVAILRGAFSRHGNITRPLGAIMSVVGLLALNLMLQNLAGRNMALIPLIVLESAVPAFICAALLFGPEIRASRETAAAARQAQEG